MLILLAPSEGKAEPRRAARRSISARSPSRRSWASAAPS